MQNSNSPWDILNSWPVIAGCFLLGLWPVGLLLIFCGDRIAAEGKRRTAAKEKPQEHQHIPVMRESRVKTESSDPKKLRDKRSRILAIVGTVLAAIGVLAFAEPLGMIIDGFSAFIWLEDLWVVISFLAAGGALIGTHVRRVRRAKRYVTYLAAMGEQESISVQDLAGVVGVSHGKAVRDLQRMVEEGYFSSGAYLDLGRDRLYRSGSAAAKELQREGEEAAQAQRQTADEYESILRNIRRVNDEIADKELSDKIDRIESITRRIFAEVERHPEKRRQITTLLNYYLPTTQKLLDSYARFEAAGTAGETTRQAKLRIEGTMDRIVAAFESQLDALYSSDAMDVESDIRVMEQMLQRDGVGDEKQFGLKL